MSLPTFNPAETATIVANWTEVHRYSPAPRHRRRLMLQLLKKLNFTSCLDAGCAHADFLTAAAPLYPQARFFGCDLCREVIERNQQTIGGIEFAVANLIEEPYPGRNEFDLVVTSEVLEHIEDWQTALIKLLQLSRRYIIVTVPAGKRYKMDQRIGHFRHYRIEDVASIVEAHGFTVRSARYWGFPVLSSYKYVINAFAPGYLYEEFGQRPYGLFKKTFCQFLYALFFLNDLFPSLACGGQLLLLAERTNPPTP
jgi:SAM-dependent methyltransferase